MIKYDRKILKDMFDGQAVSPVLPYESMDSDRGTVELLVKGNGRISLSGVQPKYSMVVDGDIIRFAHQGEQGHYILKPAPTALFILDRKYCPVNEHLTMQLAKDVFGIDAAPSCLCEFGNGELAYLVRRFDIRPEGGKYAQEDFAQLAGINKDNNGEDYKYDVLSYEDCAGLIREHTNAVPVEMLKFFRLVVFNYIVLNDDAHIKNFSVIEKHTGIYSLAPAYDLMNTSLHLSTPSIFALRKGLFKEGMLIDDTHGVNRTSFMEFGTRIGLPLKLVSKEIDKVVAKVQEATTFIENSLLSDSLKKTYRLSLKYRIFTLSE